jgi:hypothetical protein
LATITRLEDALTDTEVFGELICNLIDNIKSKFQYVYNNDLFIFASCLDPNFTFQWINAAEKSGIKRKFKAFLEADVQTSKPSSPKKLWRIFPGRDSLEGDSDDSVQKEIKTFLNLSDTYMDTHLKNYVKDSNPNKPNAPYACVYTFWRNNCSLLPIMAEKAIPATSAACERFFSKTTYIVRPHRSSISDKLTENFFF